MSYSFQEKDGILVLTVEEPRATVEFSNALKEDLIRQIEQTSSKVIVDLTACEFVDSSFLGALVAGLKKATMHNGDLKIIGLQPPVKAMFELTRLYRIFDLYEDLEQALQSF